MHHAKSSPREAWLFVPGGSLPLGSHSCSVFFSGLNCKSQMTFMPLHFASCRYSKRTVGRAAAANKQFLSKVWDCPLSTAPALLHVIVVITAKVPAISDGQGLLLCQEILSRRVLEARIPEKVSLLILFLKNKKDFAPRWYGEHIQDGAVSLQ